MRSVILVAGAWFCAVACGGASGPAPTSPSPSPNPSPSAAASVPVVVAAPPVVAAGPPAVVEPAPAPSPEVPPPPPPALEVTKRACRGDRLEMAAVAAACRVSPSQTIPTTLPAGITVSIAPSPLVVKPGKTRKAAVVYANTTAADVTLGLDDTCGHADDVSSSIQTAAGVRVDEEGEQCGHGEGCGRAGLGIVLTPGGTLRIPFVVDARLQTFGPDCKERRVGAVRPGSYELHVSSVAGEQIVPVRVGR